MGSDCNCKNKPSQGGWVQIVKVRINPVRVDGSDCNCKNKPSLGGWVQIVKVRINPARVDGNSNSSLCGVYESRENFYGFSYWVHLK